MITSDDTAEQIANLALFSNVQSDTFWYGTEYAPFPGSLAWTFSTMGGAQLIGAKIDAAFSLVVRPGDVTTSVPEPQTLALALLALGATVVVRRWRPA